MDLETTGFGDDAKIVEVAAIRMEGWTPVDELQTLVHPQRHIPSTAARVHLIDDIMVENAPTFQDIAPTLAHFLQDAVIIGHNFFTFDLRFLVRELRAHFGAGPDYFVVDTLPLARHFVRSEKYKLEHLASLLGIPLDDAHQAMSDVYATCELWLVLFRQLLARGAVNLEDLSRFKAMRQLDGSGLPRFEAAPPRRCLPRAEAR